MKKRDAMNEAGKYDARCAAADAAAVDRFWRHVTGSGDCWLYRPVTHQGYGVYYLRSARARITAHRFALVLARGPCAGMGALHRCRARNCVRPEHLYWGTVQQNNADRERDGTTPSMVGVRNSRARLSCGDVCMIWHLLYANAMTWRNIARRYGVSVSCIGNIASSRAWTHTTQMLPRLPPRVALVERGRLRRCSKLDEAKVRAIRVELSMGFFDREIAKRYGVAKSTIQAVREGRTWKHVA